MQGKYSATTESNDATARKVDWFTPRHRMGSEICHYHKVSRRVGWLVSGSYYFHCDSASSPFVSLREQFPKHKYFAYFEKCRCLEVISPERGDSGGDIFVMSL